MIDAALRKFVRERARNRCEYCCIHQDQDPFFTFPIDHIIARQHGGRTEPDNLCLSCYRCNSHKGPNIASIDSDTEEMVPLFTPAKKLARTFRVERQPPSVVRRWSCDRCAAAINHPDYILLRESLMVEGTFPPNTQ